MKRIFSILVVMLVLTCSVLAAASGSTSPTPSTDQEDVAPLPDRAIDPSEATYLDGIPLLPAVPSWVTIDRDSVIQYGLQFDQNYYFARSFDVPYVFAFRFSGNVVFCSDEKVTYYRGALSNSLVTFQEYTTSRYNGTSNLYYYVDATLGRKDFVPVFSSLQEGLSAVRFALDAAFGSPVNQSTVLDALHHTNNMLAGLFFCLGITTGSVVMRYFWGSFG